MAGSFDGSKRSKNASSSSQRTKGTKRPRYTDQNSSLICLLAPVMKLATSLRFISRFLMSIMAVCASVSVLAEAEQLGS